jgi:hypothetical protein
LKRTKRHFFRWQLFSNAWNITRYLGRSSPYGDWWWIFYPDIIFTLLPVKVKNLIVNFYTLLYNCLVYVYCCIIVIFFFTFYRRIIRPWIGFWFTSIQMVPLSHLEHIYRKFSDVDNGLYISNVWTSSILCLFLRYFALDLWTSRIGI